MLEITIWDVKHGSAAYIKTPNNRHIVVDLGDAEDFSPFKTLHARGVRQLDVVVITHPHRDHIDDILNFDLLSPVSLSTPRHLTEDEIRQGNRQVDLPVVNQYLNIRQRFNGGVGPANDITVPANYGGAKFEVFAPLKCAPGNINNHSFVVVAEFAGSKIVIPGDNEAASWNELLGNPRFVQAVAGTSILVAAHHGRDNGYCPELFDVMGKPNLVVISDGRFGDTSATGRYHQQATGWKVFDPDGGSEERKCLTTRCDGHITVKFGWNPGVGMQAPIPYMQVTTGKAKDNVNSWASILLGLGPK
jgi:hypothetical protein